MAAAQLFIHCKCGLKAVQREYYDAAFAPLILSCPRKKTPCNFGLCIEIVESQITFPQIMVYTARERIDGKWQEKQTFSSFRNHEKAFMEFKNWVPKMSAENALAEYLRQCKKTSDLFQNSFFRTLINSLSRSNQDIPVVKMFMGIEALEIGLKAEEIANSLCEDCMFKKNQTFLNKHIECRLSQDEKINKYFEEASKHLDYTNIIKKWLKVIQRMESQPYQISLNMIITDDLITSSLWFKCVKELAMIISLPKSFYKQKH